MQENGSENGPYLCRGNLRGGEATGEQIRRRAVMPIERESRAGEFELDAYIFWERVRALAQLGLEETGGLPCGKEGALFDLLEGCCEVFETALRRRMKYGMPGDMDA